MLCVREQGLNPGLRLLVGLLQVHCPLLQPSLLLWHTPLQAKSMKVWETSRLESRLDFSDLWFCLFPFSLFFRHQTAVKRILELEAALGQPVGSTIHVAWNWARTATTIQPPFRENSLSTAPQGVLPAAWRQFTKWGHSKMWLRKAKWAAWHHLAGMWHSWDSQQSLSESRLTYCTASSKNFHSASLLSPEKEKSSILEALIGLIKSRLHMVLGLYLSFFLGGG